MINREDLKPSQATDTYKTSTAVTNIPPFAAEINISVNRSRVVKEKQKGGVGITNSVIGCSVLSWLQPAVCRGAILNPKSAHG